ncbi:MAG: type II secretion system protein GspM [Thiohalomonadales bacterium]
MKDWYENLQQKEKRMLMFGGIALGLMLIYLLLWEPLAENYKSAKKNSEKYEKLVAWMEQHAAEVRVLRATMAPSAGRGNQSILGVVDKTAKQIKLSKNLKQVRPDGNNKARVRLEDAPFDTVIRWLELLQQQQGITLVSSSIQKQGTNGLVNARLVFEGASQ